MSAQPDLFSVLPELPPEKAFDGETYEPNRDHARMRGQLLAVYTLMLDGRWRTLADIERVTSGSQAAISARLRDLRKEKYGSHTVNREHIVEGLFKYQLVLNTALDG